MNTLSVMPFESPNLLPDVLEIAPSVIETEPAYPWLGDLGNPNNLRAFAVSTYAIRGGKQSAASEGQLELSSDDVAEIGLRVGEALFSQLSPDMTVEDKSKELNKPSAVTIMLAYEEAAKATTDICDDKDGIRELATDTRELEEILIDHPAYIASGSPEDQTIARETIGRVLITAGKLNGLLHREIFDLTISDYTLREIAEKTNTTLGTVKAIRSRTRQKLAARVY